MLSVATTGTSTGSAYRAVKRTARWATSSSSATTESTITVSSATRPSTARSTCTYAAEPTRNAATNSAASVLRRVGWR